MNRYDASAAGAFDLAARDALATPDLPPEFSRYVERQRLIGACAYRKAANQLPALSGRRATAIPPADLPRFCPADREALAVDTVMRTHGRGRANRTPRWRARISGPSAVGSSCVRKSLSKPGSISTRWIAGGKPLDADKSVAASRPRLISGRRPRTR
jgi:hypothetical protein